MFNAKNAMSTFTFKLPIQFAKKTVRKVNLERINDATNVQRVVANFAQATIVLNVILLYSWKMLELDKNAPKSVEKDITKTMEVAYLAKKIALSVKIVKFVLDAMNHFSFTMMIALLSVLLHSRKLLT